MVEKTVAEKRYARASSKNTNNYWYDRITGVGNAWIFQKFLKPTDSVLQFLPQTGFLLDALTCAERYGIETNPKYAKHAQEEFGIKVASTWGEFKNLDAVIFSHVLAQQEDPLGTLDQAYNSMKDGGTLVALVPCYTHKMKYLEPNYEQHLFSWSPMDIGNLVTRAGFQVKSVERICHRLFPKADLVLRFGGERVFQLACRTVGWLFPTQTQIRVVAVKKPNAARSKIDIWSYRPAS